MPARRIERTWKLQLLEFNTIWTGDLNRLGNAEFFDESADDRSLFSVDARLDARVTADGDETRLDRTDRAVGVLADKDVAIVDVHPHHAAGRPNHALGNKVAHRPYDARVVGAHPPMADVNNRRAVSFERGRVQFRLIGSVINLAQWHLGIEPLGVLLVTIEDEWRANKSIVNHGLGVLHARAIAKGETQFGFQIQAFRQLSEAQSNAKIVRDRLLA